METIKSPKQRKQTKLFRDHWYPYYAGFSSDFVSSVLNNHSADDINFILDPWNGSGTTTTVASSMQVKSIGIDINPVMTIVAKARNLSQFDVVRAKSIALDTIANYKPLRPSSGLLIESWYSNRSAWFFNGLIESLSLASGFSREDLKRGDIDRATSALILCIFLLSKSQTGSLKSKNPTWIRKSIEDKIDIDEKSSLIDFSRLVSEKIASSVFRNLNHNTSASIFTGYSESLPYPEKFFDLIVGSPPYATRIDYAVTTALELAILGYSTDEFSEFRKRFMGTTSVNSKMQDVDLNDSSLRILEMIYNHDSKASKGYYFKTYKDYFIKLESSLRDLCRVTSEKGHMYLVVQDSHYKEIRIDLARIVESTLEANGFNQIEKVGFVDSLTKKNANRSSSKYRPPSSPTEYVIHARR